MQKFLCVHGHFYQPPRIDPFSGNVPHEPGAEPFHDFNEKIDAECYRLNADLGNFGRISHNVGPTLMSWLEKGDPETYEDIIAANRRHYAQHGCNQAIAQPYHHTILPLATIEEKRIQIAWGIADFQHRFGYSPEGMWLPETAVDFETLQVMAEQGILFTILAPWQAEGSVDNSRPYRVWIGNGQEITVFFFNQRLSQLVSFDSEERKNADFFAKSALCQEAHRTESGGNHSQLLLITNDGETYGHHGQGLDQFLCHLLTVSAPSEGFEIVTSLADYLRNHPAETYISLNERSSWSCLQGIRRWSSTCLGIQDCGWKEICACSGTNGTWKSFLREALKELARRIDCLFHERVGTLVSNSQTALEDFIHVRLGRITARDFLENLLGRRPSESETRFLPNLFEAMYYRHQMFVSCAFFFEHLDRPEPRIALASAAKAIQLVRFGAGIDLEDAFVYYLATSSDKRESEKVVKMYRQIVEEELSIV